MKAKIMTLQGIAALACMAFIGTCSPALSLEPLSATGRRAVLPLTENGSKAVVFTVDMLPKGTLTVLRVTATPKGFSASPLTVEAPCQKYINPGYANEYGAVQLTTLGSLTDAAGGKSATRPVEISFYGNRSLAQPNYWCVLTTEAVADKDRWRYSQTSQQLPKGTDGTAETTITPVKNPAVQAAVSFTAFGKVIVNAQSTVRPMKNGESVKPDITVVSSSRVPVTNESGGSFG